MCCLQNDRTPTYKILDVRTQKSCQKLQNKARKAIGKARRNKEDTRGPYEKYRKARTKFRKIFQQAKRKYNIKQIQKAITDTTGAEFYRVIKQPEPQLNKSEEVMLIIQLMQVKKLNELLKPLKIFSASTMLFLQN